VPETLVQEVAKSASGVHGPLHSLNLSQTSGARHAAEKLGTGQESLPQG
jgi:hypothetical protein